MEKSAALVTVAAGVPAAAFVALPAAGLRAAAAGGRRGRHVALRHHRLLRLLAARRFRVLAALPAARRAVRRLLAMLGYQMQVHMHLYAYTNVFRMTGCVCLQRALNERKHCRSTVHLFRGPHSSIILSRTCFGIQSVSTS